MTKLKESHCDVLIVGAGPAGLMVATQLAQLGVDARIIDKMPHRVLKGHADGIHFRTSEVLDAMGLYNVLRDEGYFWKYIWLWDANGERPRMDQKISFENAGYSHMPACMLAQEAIERNFINEIEKHGRKVERLLAPKEMEIDETKEYPVTVTLQTVSPPEGFDASCGLYRSNVRIDDGYAKRPDGEPCEVIHCKYLVGADGAHSWVRKRLGLDHEGDRSSSFWGALDIVVDTALTTLGGLNIWQRGRGGVLALPRERGMTRFYVPLGTSEGGFDKASMTLDKILAILKDWLSPLHFEALHVDWWTVYEVAQRCTATMEAHDGRVLIAGDACHTHSPKAGQGMNVSMMDGFNLAWKLAGVLSGTLNPEVVRTYNSERLEVAQTLINFDREWAANFTGGKEANVEILQKAFAKALRNMSGTGVQYRPSLVVAEDCNAQLARNVVVGARFETSSVEEVYSGMPIELQKRLVPNGRWKVILFPGDVSEDQVRTELSRFDEGLLALVRRFTKPDADLDGMVEVITVFKSSHDDVQRRLNEFDEILHPHRTLFGVKRCYPAKDTLHVDPTGEAYERYGIDKDAAILVRPDQHVAGVFGISSDGLKGMDDFLSCVLVPSSTHNGE